MKKKASVKALINIKSLPAKRREEIRGKLFALWRKGVKAYAAAKQLRIHERTAYHLYGRFRDEREGAVAEKRRGPAASPRASLTPGETERLAAAVSGGDPRQLVLGFALWSSRAVVAFAREKFGKEISRRAARRLVRRLGYTYQRPVRRAREQDAAAVRGWLDRDYPAIRTLARENGASIFWADEASCQASGVKARGYSPRGRAPVLNAPANRRVRCNYIAAVSNRGELYFQTFADTMTADRFRRFAQGLVADVGGPVVLIVDNLRVHHADCLQGWLGEMERSGSLWVRYLPSYSPELNPEEYLNRDVKAAAAERDIPGTAEKLAEQTVAHLQKRRNDPDAVRRVAFGHRSVAYARDNT